MQTEIVQSYSVIDAGLVASDVASRSTMQDYTQRKATNTLRSHSADLATFSCYLNATGVSNYPTAKAMQSDPSAWRGVTWGLLSGFVQWMLKQGFALGTINRKLSTAKTYAALACQAGVIQSGELTLIKSVRGFAPKEFSRVDEKRTTARIGSKKRKAIAITLEQASRLKDQPQGTPQGRRDAVIMCMLLEQGLRVGELAELTATDINLNHNKMVFYRSKVQKEQTHWLSPETRNALLVYFESDGPITGSLLRGSSKTRQLTVADMGERSLHERVRLLGEAIGITGLSPHDCRHYWATSAIHEGTDPFSLLQAGGWTSMQTMKKYVAENEVANAGVRLPQRKQPATDAQ